MMQGSEFGFLIGRQYREFLAFQFSSQDFCEMLLTENTGFSRLRDQFCGRFERYINDTDRFTSRISLLLFIRQQAAEETAE